MKLIRKRRNVTRYATRAIAFTIKKQLMTKRYSAVHISSLPLKKHSFTMTAIYSMEFAIGRQMTTAMNIMYKEYAKEMLKVQILK